VPELPTGLERLIWTGPGIPDTASVAARLRAEGVEPYAWSNGPDDRYEVHQHGYTKLMMCAAGSITFLVGADAVPVPLQAGDGFVLPAGMPHAAVVGASGCACLEGHRA
jgi:uncharacterized protein YjlB